MNDRFPTTKDELRDMLHKGMGRAVLYLLGQDLSQYRDLILECCLHHYAYDRQVEDTRAEYLYPLITRSCDEDHYRNQIVGALPSADDDDVGQLLDFAVLFARDGHEPAREAIYDKLRQSVDDPEWDGDTEPVELDGAAGLLTLLRIAGEAGRRMTEWDIVYLIEQAIEASSVDEVRSALCAAAADRRVARTLESVGYTGPSAVEQGERWRERQKAAAGHSRYGFSENTTWEEARDRVDSPLVLFSWARLASDSEFAKAAGALDPLDDPERLRFHLRAFWKREFPLDPAPLIALVDHSDERVAIAALSALENVEHPAVRELLERLRQGHPLYEHCIGLLQSNYQPGDEAIMIDMLERETDPDRLHSLAMDTRQVYEDNPVPEGMQAMLLAYEKTPCSMCRYGCVEVIESLGLVPDWMIEECLYDADESARELAAKLKQA